MPTYIDSDGAPWRFRFTPNDLERLGTPEDLFEQILRRGDDFSRLLRSATGADGVPKIRSELELNDAARKLSHAVIEAYLMAERNRLVDAWHRRCRAAIKRGEV